MASFAISIACSIFSPNVIHPGSVGTLAVY